LPASNAISAATQPAVKMVAAPVEWQAQLSDRIDSIAVTDGKVVAYTANSIEAVINAKGETSSTVVNTIPVAVKPVTAVPTPLKASLIPGAAVKSIAISNNNITAISYWGGIIQTFGADNMLKTQQTMPQDINALVWNGNILIAGLADGCVVGLNVK